MAAAAASCLYYPSSWSDIPYSTWLWIDHGYAHSLRFDLLTQFFPSSRFTSITHLASLLMEFLNPRCDLADNGTIYAGPNSRRDCLNNDSSILLPLSNAKGPLALRQLIDSHLHCSVRTSRFVFSTPPYPTTCCSMLDAFFRAMTSSLRQISRLRKIV